MSDAVETRDAVQSGEAVQTVDGGAATAPCGAR